MGLMGTQNEAKIAEAKRLWMLGKPVSEIAKAVGLSIQQVCKIIRGGS